MANRLVGNVIIVDSAMGNLEIFMGTGSLVNLSISALSFWYSTTGGSCIFTGANTTDVIARFNLLQVGTGVSLFHNPHVLSFASPLKMSELKVPTVSAGTGYVYLA